MSIQLTLEAKPRANAREWFNRISNRGKFLKFWSAFVGQNRTLLSLPDFEQKLQVHERYEIGAQTVSIAQIRGSENRCGDFDVEFRPLQNHTRERWVNIAVAMDDGEPMPAVDLVQIGGTYFVRDGHHRISVARARGQESIDANVIRAVSQNDDVSLSQLFSEN